MIRILRKPCKRPEDIAVLVRRSGATGRWSAPQVVQGYPPANPIKLHPYNNRGLTTSRLGQLAASYRWIVTRPSKHGSRKGTEAYNNRRLAKYQARRRYSAADQADCNVGRFNSCQIVADAYLHRSVAKLVGPRCAHLLPDGRILIPLIWTHSIRNIGGSDEPLGNQSRKNGGRMLSQRHCRDRLNLIRGQVCTPIPLISTAYNRRQSGQFP